MGPILDLRLSFLRVLIFGVISSVILFSSHLSAQVENPYHSLSEGEADALVTRLVANPSLLEKLPEEKKDALSNAKQFQDALLKRHEELLSMRNAGEVLVLKRLIQNLYPQAGPVQERFDEINKFGERVEHLFATENVQALKDLSADPSLSDLERRILEAQLLSFLHTKAAELIKLNQNIDAIGKLAEISSDRRSSETWTLTTQAVSNIIKDKGVLKLDILERADLQDLLIALGEKDPGSKQSIVEILSLAALAASKAGRLEETSKTIKLLRVFNPDPSNDDLYRNILVECGGAVRKELAPSLLEQLKERNVLSTGLKFRLVIRGYYGPAVPTLIILSIVFPAIGGIVYLLSKLRKRFSDARVAISLPPLPKIKKFRKEKVLPGYMKPIELDEVETDDEYTRLLRLFNLSDEATEDEIKKSYRLKMKELHPDKAEGRDRGNIENSEEFRELKHAHDRILEIRRSWFRGRAR